MIITINRKQFLAALRTVKLAAAKTDTSGIHPEAVLINAGMGNLRLACMRNESNFNYSIITNVAVEMDPAELAQCAVTGRILRKLVGLCSGETITLEFPENISHPLIIRDGNNSFGLLAVDPDSTYARIVRDRECTIDAPGLLAVARRVAFAASTEDARPALQGVMFNGKVAATDGFRFALWPTGFEPVHGLIPAKVLRIAGRIFRGVDPMIWMDEDRIAFSAGSTTLETNRSLLLNNNFPDVDTIMPKKAKLAVELDAGQLARALTMLCAIEDGYNISAMSMTVNQTSATLHKRGDAEITFDAEIDAKVVSNEGVALPFEVAFNPVLLLELVKQAGKRIAMYANASNLPVIWRPADQADPWMSLLMPMHVG